LIDSADAVLRYCDIKYAVTGVSINENGTTVTAPTIDRCTIKFTSRAGIFGGVKAAPAISCCVIRDIAGSAGIHLQGAYTSTITNTSVSIAPTGIILYGNPNAYFCTTINRCVVYDADMNLTNSPTWWTGYGIYISGDSGRATITNAIIARVSLYCLNKNTLSGWTINENYNLFYPAIGLGGIQTGVASAFDILDADPFFNNPVAGDFSFDPSSPVCISYNCTAFDDCPDIGVSDILRTPSTKQVNIIMISNQLHVSTRGVETICLAIYNLKGHQIWSGSGKEVTWDGSRMNSGVYYYTVQVSGQVFGNSLVITK
jgi:hypothetical protein